MQEDFTWQEIWQTSIHCIAFNIFSCRILIILYKTLFVTGTSNEETNELIIYGILGWNVTILYGQELVSLFQVQENWKRAGVQN